MENKIKERDSINEDKENEIKKVKKLQEVFNRPGKLYIVTHIFLLELIVIIVLEQQKFVQNS